MGKLKNRKVSQVKMVTGVSNSLVDWIWRLCNMGFEGGVVPKD